MPHFGDPDHIDPREAQLRGAETKNRKRHVFDRVMELLESDDEEFEECARAYLAGLKAQNSPLWGQLLDRTMGPVKQVHDHLGHLTPHTQLSIGESHTSPPAPLPFAEEENRNGED